nr:MAG TPA: helix-turn-helix domain protein [Caudoviricetes sp.]
MINSMELKAEIKRSGLTQDQLANKIGIDPSTLNRKINNKNSTLSVDEAQKIVAVLNIPEEKLAVIFFNSKLA